MGLRISHGCWNYSYNAFSRYRNKLAKSTGYEVWPVKRSDGVIRPTIIIDWGHLPDCHALGDWENVLKERLPNDPLIYLFTHSDHKGYLRPKYCKKLLKNLEYALPCITDDEVCGGTQKTYRELTEDFIEGLKKAVNRDEKIEFG